LLNALAQKELIEHLGPTLTRILREGGGAEAVLKKTEKYAAVTLASLLVSENDAVRRQAAKDILERVSGKAVERSVNIYGDIAKLNERDIDQQILQLIGKTQADKILEATVVRERPIKQSRKPRKSQPLVEGPDPAKT
jgi:hypothetical protein